MLRGRQPPARLLVRPSPVSPHPLAGQPAPADLLVDVPALIAAYYTELPDPGEPTQQVSFGTSGHRGSALKRSFNERHIAAITEAIVSPEETTSFSSYRPARNMPAAPRTVAIERFMRWRVTRSRNRQTIPVDPVMNRIVS